MKIAGSVLDRLASSLGRRDEVPNQELAKTLATRADRPAIRLIAENLWNPDKNIQSDCIKVLYEIGYLNPKLIAGYVPDFVKLLSSKTNRLVWGAMIALATVAPERPTEVFEHRDRIIRTIQSGSVIAFDNGVKILARLAAADAAYSRELFPLLIGYLTTCRPTSVAQYAESTLCAVNAGNVKEYAAVLAQRHADLSPAQAARIHKILKTLDRADPKK